MNARFPIHRLTGVIFESIIRINGDIYIRKGAVMTISERIFKKLRQIKMSQKDFSDKTGISQSTISEWKSKGTNPTSEKIMIICKVLGVTPEWLLSGSHNTGARGNELPWYVVDKDTEIGELITDYNNMDENRRNMLRGYMVALKQINR